jgi:hypothetical protein
MALADELAAAVHALVGELDAGQRREVMLPFDGDERRTWAYWPTARRGVPLHRLQRSQTKAVHRVLGRLLPLPTFAQATAIMGLDEVLDALDGWRGDRRHRDDYWVSIFGQPGGDRWGWRFEGHHVSIHATVVGGEVQVTPLFLGAHPAAVRDGEHVVLAPLAREEQLGFELLHHLSVEQRSTAVVSSRAPDDIATRNEATITDLVDATGVPVAALTGPAAGAAAELLRVHLDRFPAGSRRPDPDGARFAWAGADRPGIGHYYRLSGPRLLVELDNTQNGANHVHIVVRDPDGDFGRDLLGEHHRRSHDR